MGNMPTVLPKDFLLNHINSLYEEGLPSGVFTGVNCLDKIFRLDRGRLLTVTGVPNYGKSEFVDFLVTSFNKRLGWKTLFFSPENQPIELHLSKLVSKFINKPFSKNSISKDELNKSISYISDNFYFFNYQRVRTLEDILREAEAVIRDRGMDVLVLDAYNKIESDIPAGEIETSFISKVLDKLTSFAIKNNILIILVAHPKKMEYEESKGAYKCPRAYDINGSANFYNKSDFVLTVHRDFSKEEVIIKVDKVKFKNYGKTGECRLKYDEASGNYYEPKEDSRYYREDDDESEYTPEPFSFPKSDSRDPLDVEVSVYKGATDNKGDVMKLKDFLLTDKYKDIAEKIRKGATPEDRHAIKNSYKASIPCVAVSGKFSERGANNLIQSSRLISIDIDYKDNKEVISRVPEILKSLPYVAFFSKSITGDGYFAICEISNPSEFQSHYFALEEDFKALGINIDKSCKDVSRLRFATYDSEAYYNPFAVVYDKVKVIEKASTPVQHYSSASRAPYTSFSQSSSIATLDRYINAFETSGGSLPDDYNSWYQLGMSLGTLGEEGREYFHRLSGKSSKYDAAECDRQYNDILSRYSGNNHYTLGTAIKMLKDNTLMS